MLQIDSLEEQIKEKDMQVSSTKAKLASLQADHSSSGTALSSLEELLADKDQQIEKFVGYNVLLLRTVELFITVVVLFRSWILFTIEIKFIFGMAAVGTEVEIQLPLKRFPDPSVSSLIRTGWFERAVKLQPCLCFRVCG